MDERRFLGLLESFLEEAFFGGAFFASDFVGGDIEPGEVFFLEKGKFGFFTGLGVFEVEEEFDDEGDFGIGEAVLIEEFFELVLAEVLFGRMEGDGEGRFAPHASRRFASQHDR